LPIVIPYYVSLAGLRINSAVLNYLHRLKTWCMNFLFITADQWRGDCLSLIGHSHVKTPNMDLLATDGVAFKRHSGQALVW
jgi:hypothetical protein